MGIMYILKPTDRVLLLTQIPGDKLTELGQQRESMLTCVRYFTHGILVQHEDRKIN